MNQFTITGELLERLINYMGNDENCDEEDYLNVLAISRGTVTEDNWVPEIHGYCCNANPQAEREGVLDNMHNKAINGSNPNYNYSQDDDHAWALIGTPKPDYIDIKRAEAAYHQGIEEGRKRERKTVLDERTCLNCGFRKKCKLINSYSLCWEAELRTIKQEEQG